MSKNRRKDKVKYNAVQRRAALILAIYGLEHLGEYPTVIKIAKQAGFSSSSYLRHELEELERAGLLRSAKQLRQIRVGKATSEEWLAKFGYRVVYFVNIEEIAVRLPFLYDVLVSKVGVQMRLTL